MPDSGALVMSFVCAVLGIQLILFPNMVVSFSGWFNRVVTTLDPSLLRYRYLVGVLLAVGSYAFFKLALLLPQLR